jgi:hypothetical protein
VAVAAGGTPPRRGAARGGAPRDRRGDRHPRRGPRARRGVPGAPRLAPAAAQKDYYNLDKNRPVRIEDAYATERYALEVKVAPLRLERERGGVYHWGFDPEIAYGILPRTSVEVGFPLAVIDGGEGGRTSGLWGIELSAFHNLNIETRTLPALGMRADVTLPVGSLSATASTRR